MVIEVFNLLVCENIVKLMMMNKWGWGGKLLYNYEIFVNRLLLYKVINCDCYFYM